MAGNVKPNVYTGATAALSVYDANGLLKRVAYVSDFTIDLNSNTDEFSVLGQTYQEVIPTFNNWSGSSSAKASFENEGQIALLNAYQTLQPIKCEFIINQTDDNTKLIKAVGFATIESLSIGVGDSVSSFDISLRGSGNLGFTLPQYKAVTAVTVTPEEVTLSVGSSIQLEYSVSPKNASNPVVKWKSADETKVKVDENGFVVAIAPTGDAGVAVTCTSDANEEALDTCKVIVTA